MKPNVKIKGEWRYLYRAINSTGATLDFLLSAKRDADAAKRLFRKALRDASHPQPRIVNTDLAPIYPPAIAATPPLPSCSIEQSVTCVSKMDRF